MSSKWVLEGYFGKDDSQLHRFPMVEFPISVGRDPNSSFPIDRTEVSRNHAEFLHMGGNLVLHDLGSTNGTFVNDKQIDTHTKLSHGDVIHFSGFEVRVLEESGSTEKATPQMTVIRQAPRDNKLPTGLAELQTLLNERAIKSQFQPIVSPSGELYGYEVLGRGSRPDLPVSPMELFRIAESMPGKDAELSLLMRDCGVDQACLQSKAHRLFVNTHPAEMKRPKTLLNSILRLRKKYPTLPIVLEIHENAVTNIEMLKKFSAALTKMRIELAYDDFGAGQARLMEMTEVPVKYVKFDIALIRGLHKAPEVKQNMVATLVKMTQDMGIQALAEGVEYGEELALCRQMNFDLIQGYYFGKPSHSLEYKNRLQSTELVDY